jgi:hypothetical protein
MFLHDYISCQETPKEEIGYQPFVFAFNHALRALHKIDDLPLRKSTELTLLFHRNDHKPINATHNGHQSTRIPDIILVSLDAARNAFSEDDLGTWADHALKSAAEAPRIGFEWSSSLSVAELRRPNRTLSLPPAVYTIKVVDEIPPQNLQKEPTQPSKEAMPNPLNSFRGSCKPPLSNILSCPLTILKQPDFAGRSVWLHYPTFLARLRPPVYLAVKNAKPITRKRPQPKRRRRV